MNQADIDDGLRRLARVRDEELKHVANGAGAYALLQGITSDPAVSRRTRFPVRTASIAAAAAVVAGVLVASQVLHPAVAAAGVGFDTRGSYLVARATNTDAGAAAMSAAFAEQGLDIQVELTATSPSLVGMVAGLGVDEGGGGAIRILEEGECWRGEQLGGCQAGLLIRLDFDGRAHVIFGRSADAGESYDIQGDVFGAGEDLHCYASRVLNGDPSDAMQTITSTGVSVDWWRVIGGDLDRPDPLEGASAEQLTPELSTGRFVTDVWGLSDGHVGVLISNEADAPESPAYLRFVNQGCP